MNLQDYDHGDIYRLGWVIFLRQHLKRWGFRFHNDNFYEGYSIKIKKMEQKGQLQVHEMLSLMMQWVEADSTNPMGLMMPDVECLVVIGMEGNEEVREEDLPVTVIPKISYQHQVGFVLLRVWGDASGTVAVFCKFC